MFFAWTYKTIWSVPLFKKDDTSDIANYRAICLIPLISKVFEKFIFVKLNTHFISDNLFYQDQYSLRVNKSTALAALHWFDNVTQEMDRGNIPIININLDLSITFDTLDRSILI